MAASPKRVPRLIRRIRTPPVLRPLLPFRFREIEHRFGRGPFAILDVGAGNHSASLTKRYFPKSYYAAIDLDRGYCNGPDDFVAMDAFFEMDLTKLAFHAIPDERYDVIIMSHVIEHLENGDRVIAGLLPKLREGGLIYVEFPGERSLRLPSMPESLNFHDDPTHVRLFTAREVSDLLATSGLEIVAAGVRRDPWGIALMIPKILKHILARGFVPGPVFWDLLGFADYVIGIKPRRLGYRASEVQTGCT